MQLNLLRRKVIQEAQSWIGTQFHHQGRIKHSSLGKGGCDCIGLILGIAKKTSSKFILLNEDLVRISIPSYLKDQIIKYKIVFDNQLLDLVESYNYKYEMQGSKEPSPVNINVIKHENIINITWQLRSLNSAFWRNQFTDVKIAKTQSLVEVYQDDKKIISEVLGQNNYSFVLNSKNSYQVKLFFISSSGELGIPCISTL